MLFSLVQTSSVDGTQERPPAPIPMKKDPESGPEKADLKFSRLMGRPTVHNEQCGPWLGRAQKMEGQDLA